MIHEDRYPGRIFPDSYDENSKTIGYCIKCTLERDGFAAAKQ